MALGSASDLAFMLKDAGVPVTYNPDERLVPYTGFGIVHVEDVQMVSFDGGTIAGRRRRVVVATDTFPGLGEGKSIEVDGVMYRITQAWQQGDGALTDVWLASA